MGKRREQLNEFYSGMKKASAQMPDQLAGFQTMLKATLQSNVLDFKTKELISVAIACFSRCEYCIVYHVHSALKAGASAQEIIDAGLVSVVFGGGPAMSHIVTVLDECLEEFQNDFNR